MYRLALIFATLAGLVLLAGSAALAQTGAEYPLPPIKLKPEKPITVDPIPPSPDTRPPLVPVTSVEAAPPAAASPTVPLTPPVLTPTPLPPPPPPVVTPPPLPVITPPPPVVTPPPPPPVAPPVIMPPAAPAAPAKTAAPAAVMKLPPMPPDLVRDRAPEAPAPPAAARPSDLEKETAEAQAAPKPEDADLNNLGEVALVEELSRSRKAYARSMLALRDYYSTRANATKLEWINTEYVAFDKGPKPMYLGVAELGAATLRPTRRIEAADKLYEEGLQMKDYPAMPAPISNPGKDTYLKKALEKFQTIIEKYPDSDKIDDAAFRMGEIYGGWYFEDWTRAVQCYERCWQWNPHTPLPAVLNAAKIYDEHLKNRAKAVELYNRVLTESNNPDQVKQAREAIKNLTGK
jgi:hypothetical protein